MAYLVCLTYTNFLFSSFISVDAVRAFVNTQGPKPQVRFVAEPPNVVIAPPVKGKPVYLQCHATVELEKTALKTLQCGDSDQSFDLDFEDNDRLQLEDDYEDETRLDDPGREKRIKNGYLSQQVRTHFSDLRPDGVDTIQHYPLGHNPSSVDNFEDEEDDNEGEDLMFGRRERHRRDANRPQVTLFFNTDMFSTVTLRENRTINTFHVKAKIYFEIS